MDTNVVYAGLRSDLGASHQILDKISTGQVAILLSQTVLTEYEEILKRYAPSMGLNLSDIDTTLNFLCSVCERFEMQGPWSPVLDDPDDEAFVKLASFGRADCLVTHNLRHFGPTALLGINVLAPREFLATI